MAVLEETYQLTVKLPGGGEDIKIIVSCFVVTNEEERENQSDVCMDTLQASPRENIQDIKQSIMESPDTCANSCFYLAYKGKRVNDYLELGEIEGITTESELELVEGELKQSKWNKAKSAHFVPVQTITPNVMLDSTSVVFAICWAALTSLILLPLVLILPFHF